ncbi:MAG: plasmid pRiA4b ORF-3 family protein [Bacteroidetes bacterium]|nr:plasmid pRiA4b ORF-3 family protein [Bacteroidota bacterium]
MENLLQLKINLEGIKPNIWRTVLVSNTSTVYELHHIIQIAFGWENYHAYSFSKNDSIYGNPILLDDETVINDKEIFLHELFEKRGTKINYEYDFGDGWIHSIALEDILPNDSKVKHPVCLEGERACPPEDCGGTFGYSNLVNVMKNSKHPEHKEFVKWLGKPFDSESIDLVEVNKELKTIKNYIKAYEQED